MSNTDELTPEEVADLERIMQEPDLGPFTTDQLAMLVGLYDFQECACGMTRCPHCAACHNIHCEAPGVAHTLMGIECGEMFDFLGKYHIATKKVRM